MFPRLLVGFHAGFHGRDGNGSLVERVVPCHHVGRDLPQLTGPLMLSFRRVESVPGPLPWKANSKLRWAIKHQQHINISRHQPVCERQSFSSPVAQRWIATLAPLDCPVLAPSRTRCSTCDSERRERLWPVSLLVSLGSPHSGLLSPRCCCCRTLFPLILEALLAHFDHRCLS